MRQPVRSPRVRLLNAGMLDVLTSLSDNLFDAIVTDPPYGLEFMCKGWDSFGRKRVYKPRTDKGKRGSNSLDLAYNLLR